MGKRLLKIGVCSLIFLIIGVLLLVGFQQKKEPSTLNISAAASLTDVLEELKTSYIQIHPEVVIQYNFASAGFLQHQIEQGIPADLFLSASIKQMNTLEEKNLIVKDTRTDLLKNRVVLIVPNDNNQVASFEDLTKDSITKIGIGNPATVPVGDYAQEVLNYYNILKKIKSKFIYGKNVREVLSWVKTKNVEAGIVYETDAKVARDVKVVAIAPEDSHNPVTYTVAILKNALNQQGAKDFLKYLKEDEAKAKFEKFGFTKI